MLKVLKAPLYFLAVVMFCACGGSPKQNAEEQEQIREEVQDVVNGQMNDMEQDVDEAEPEASDGDAGTSTDSTAVEGEE